MKQLPYYGYPLSSIAIRYIVLQLFILILFISIYNLNFLFILFSIILIFMISFFILSFKKKFKKYREKILKKMIELTKIQGDEIILDLGTGSGFIAIGYAKYINSGKVYGIDKFHIKYDKIKDQVISQIKINFFGNTLANAKRNVKIENINDKCEFIKADLTKPIAFPDKFFDIIVFRTINKKNDIGILFNRTGFT